MSMSMLYGPLGDSTAEVVPPAFPYNVTFRQVCFTLWCHVFVLLHIESGYEIVVSQYGERVRVF